MLAFKQTNNQPNRQGILAGLAVPAWAATNEKIEVEEEKKEGEDDGVAAASSSGDAGGPADAMEVEAVAKDEAEERAALAQLIAELEALGKEVRRHDATRGPCCLLLCCMMQQQQQHRRTAVGLFWGAARVQSCGLTPPHPTHSHPPQPRRACTPSRPSSRRTRT